MLYAKELPSLLHDNNKREECGALLRIHLAGNPWTPGARFLGVSTLVWAGNLFTRPYSYIVISVLTNKILLPTEDEPCRRGEDAAGQWRWNVSARMEKTTHESLGKLFLCMNLPLVNDNDPNYVLLFPSTTMSTPSHQEVRWNAKPIVHRKRLCLSSFLFLVSLYLRVLTSAMEYFLLVLSFTMRNNSEVLWKQKFGNEKVSLWFYGTGEVHIFPVNFSVCEWYIR